jgi:lipopolysaccharide export LptBFGC system permease protein LptF
MHDVQVKSSDERVPVNHRASVDVANLAMPAWANEAQLDEVDVIARATSLATEDPGIKKLLGQFQTQSFKLQGQVTSRLWRRWAVGFTAGLLPLLGAVLALLLRQAQPLTVYMIGFLPGLLDLVLISAGAGSIRQGNVVGGLVLMWSGSVLVLIAIGIAWWRLRRN